MTTKTPIELLRSAIMTADLNPDEVFKLLELTDLVADENEALSAGILAFSPEEVMKREQELLDEIEKLKAEKN